MEIAMTQGEANRAALAIVQTTDALEAFMRLDRFNRIVEISATKDDREGWSLIATKRNGLRVAK